MGDDDVACDHPIGCWHPHHTALRLKWLFEDKGWDYGAYTKLCTVRNPFDLLRSYYRYFRPDRDGRYNFQPEYDSETWMDFEEWILNGKSYDQTYLKWRQDLSGLGIEAYCYDESDRPIVDHMVDINDAEQLRALLERIVDCGRSRPLHVNKSDARTSRGGYENMSYSDEMRDKVYRMFRREFELFDYHYNE